MRFDDVFRRCFVVVVCFLIGAAAYFQASAMMKLVASLLSEMPRAAASLQGVPQGTSGAPSAPVGYGRYKEGAAEILARNPFDSITGPILPGGAEPPRPAPREPGDPYEDALCEGARVVLITSSEDPAWSFAAIAEGAAAPILRRLGDTVSGYSVRAIARDRVWLESDTRRCQLGLGARPAAKGPLSPVLNGPPPDAPATPPKTAAGSLPPDIASKIRKIGDREFEIERSAVSAIMERQGDLLRRVGVAPDKEGDRVVGYRLTGIRPGTLLGTLGLENGDRLHRVNGIELADMSAAMQALARLQAADRLVVSVVRRGSPVNIDVRIK